MFWSNHFLITTAACLLFPLSVYAVTKVTIAGVLSSDDVANFFKEAVEKLNTSPHISPYIRFNATTMLMEANPIRSALSVCDHLIAQQTCAVIVSHPPLSNTQPTLLDVPPLSGASPIVDLTTGPVSYTCGYYGLPVIGISSRHVALSDKHVHSTFVRTVPPYFHQVDVWVDMLRYFSWESIVFIHSYDEDGRAAYRRFLPLTTANQIRIEKVIAFTPGLVNYTDELAEIPHLQSRIILLYADKYDGGVVYESAHEIGICGKGYGWIVAEQALHSNSIPLDMRFRHHDTGSLGVRLVKGTNERAHILDSVRLFGEVFMKVLQRYNLTQPPTNCDETDTMWDDGPLIFRTLMRETIENGVTGRVSFDQFGDRRDPVYEVINVHEDGLTVTGISGTSRPHPQKLPIVIIERKLQFPGSLSTWPTSLEIVHHLEVLTIAEPPFLSVSLPTKKGVCVGQAGDSTVICRHVNDTTGVVTLYCCIGYSMDLIAIIAKYVNFSYNVSVTFDSYIGSPHTVEVNGTTTQKWDGLIGQLVEKRFDVIVSPMTIITEHASVIDFSKPFKFQGLTILAKKTAKESSLGSFLQPFDSILWLLIMLAIHAVALSLYLLDRFSPFGRFKLMKSDDTEDDALNFSSAIWFTWSVLMNSGVSEGTPRSFSARVLGMVWAGFGMILIASYTANLAAFLVLDNRPEASISGIDDSRLRNPQDNFKFATIKNSAVNLFFKKKTEYCNMFEVMQKYNYNNVTDAVNDVKKGDLQAFIWDHARLEYEASLDCSLMTLGDMFGSWQYGLGIRRGLYWTSRINEAITHLSEEDELDRLNSKWLIERQVRRPNCSLIGRVPATLGLTNMAGVFMMVGVGIFVGLVLLLIEIVYKRQNRLRDKELELARNAADRWRSNVIKRRALRRAVNTEDVHRNSLCESLLRGIAVTRSHSSSIPNATDSHPVAHPVASDNTAMLQAQAVAVFDNII